MKISGYAPPESVPLSQEEDQKLRDVSRQFESLLINDLVSQMRKTVVKGGFVPESQAERVYQSMLDTEYAIAMAQSDQVGLSALVYEHLLRTLNAR